MVSYGDPKYWDNRYIDQPEPFDWLEDYKALKPIITKIAAKDAKILMLGCGNALLSEEMYDDGYHHIENIDISSVVITQMRQRNTLRPKMKYSVMDATALEFPSQTFDLAIDKSTIDALLCGDQSFLKEVQRVLKVGGYYMAISYGSPETRLMHFTQKHLAFDIEQHTLQAAGYGKKHFIYLCKKSANSDEVCEAYWHVVESELLKEIQAEKKKNMEKAGEESKSATLLYAARAMEGLYIKELTAERKVVQVNFFPSATCFALSKDYSVLALADKAGIKLLDTKKFSAIWEVPCEYVQEVLLSSTAKYVAVYQRHSGSKTSKLSIFNSKDGTKIKEILWKRSSSIEEFTKFSSNDDYMLVSPYKTEITVFSCSDFSKPLLTHTSPLVLSVEVVPDTYLHQESKAPYYSIVESIAGTEDATAKFIPIKAPTEAKPIVKKFALKKIDDAKTLFSPNGSAVLFWAESQEDPTGKSYYGAHCMYYHQLVGGKKYCKVATEGSTIHDVKWTPSGENFVVLSGSQPAKIVLFDQECTPIYEMEAGYKNHAEFSDKGRFLMLGGFGNLAGDVEFWDLQVGKGLIGNCKAHCTVSSEWSQDSQLVMTAVLNPRMRIDNAITFIDFTGKKVATESYTNTELYEVKWIKHCPADESKIVISTAGSTLKKKMKAIALPPAKATPKEEKAAPVAKEESKSEQSKKPKKKKGKVVQYVKRDKPK